MIYLDHAATSPLLPAAHEAMAPWFGVPANPSSVHAAGQRAAAAVERARAQVAALLGRPPSGIVFTSGATEANHQALRGHAALGARSAAVAAIEHPSVHGAIAAAGLAVVPWSVDASGVVEVRGAGADVLCLMAVNHETGVIQPLDDARALAAATGARLHVDASQAAGKLDPDAWADACTVVASAHKLGGPVGVGALSLHSGGAFPALLTGGEQERGRRAGTLNVPAIVGFGAAAAVAVRDRTERWARFDALSSRLCSGLRALGGRLIGADAPRVPSHQCVVFDGIPGELLVQALDLRGFAVSSGAACASGSLEPSPVLVAMGDPQPDGALRISLGPDTHARDIEALLMALPAILEAARISS